MENTKMNIVLTIKGNIPAVWENGGGNLKKGHATIIVKANGDLKKPLYVTKKNEKTFKKGTALLSINICDIVIQTKHRRNNTFCTKIYRVISINTAELKAELLLLASYENEECDNLEIYKYFSEAIEAANKKSVEQKGDFSCYRNNNKMRKIS